MTTVSLPVLSLLAVGSTRVLDDAILEERIRYAAERIDFHSFFHQKTVRDIQRTLACPVRSEERRSVVDSLLFAQQESPHRLWTLLLIQAYEAKLVNRRRALSTDEDPAADELVLRTFTDALQTIPFWAFEEDVAHYVMCASATALAKALRAQAKLCRTTTAPVSGVACVGDTESTPDVGSSTPTEVA